MKWCYPLKPMNWKRKEWRSFSKTDRSTTNDNFHRGVNCQKVLPDCLRFC